MSKLAEFLPREEKDAISLTNSLTIHGNGYNTWQIIVCHFDTNKNPSSTLHKSDYIILLA